MSLRLSTITEVYATLSLYLGKISLNIPSTCLHSKHIDDENFIIWGKLLVFATAVSLFHVKQKNANNGIINIAKIERIVFLFMGVSSLLKYIIIIDIF